MNLTRRKFIVATGALIATPAIVRAESLMKLAMPKPVLPLLFRDIAAARYHGELPEEFISAVWETIKQQALAPEVMDDGTQFYLINEHIRTGYVVNVENAFMSEGEVKRRYLCEFEPMEQPRPEPVTETPWPEYVPQTIKGMY